MPDEAIVAPAAPSAAVIDAPAPNTPELGSQTPVAPQPEPKPEAKPDAKSDPKPAEKTPSKSADEAVKRAAEAVKAREADKAKAAEKAPEPKPAEKKTPEAESRARAEDGKFAPKESTGDKPVDGTVQAKKEGDQTSEGRKPHHEPPARFNERAKAEWAAAPDAVKEDIHRVISENEKGIQKYKEAAERFEKVKEFDELARKNGREGVHESLKQVVELENAFARNPIEGFKKVADHFGINFQAVAAHVMGENPDQRVQQAHNRIQELEAKIQHMELAAKAPDIVREFAEAHDRFEELSEVIAVLLKNGTAKDLEGAYELASVLRPASNAAPSSQPLIPANSAPAQTQAPAELPLNPAGMKSVSGAPTGGITPASKRPVPQSNHEALKRAAARLG